MSNCLDECIIFSFHMIIVKSLPPRDFLSKLLNEIVRIEVKDGRLFVGNFVVFIHVVKYKFVVY